MLRVCIHLFIFGLSELVIFVIKVIQLHTGSISHFIEYFNPANHLPMYNVKGVKFVSHVSSLTVTEYYR